MVALLVVHGVWSDGRIALWAEDTAPQPTATATGAAAADPRGSGRGRVRWHPFAADAGTLLAALGGHATGAEQAELKIALPGTTKGPIPSPESG
ncbi:hypothetical protein C1I98_29240, partial [Spongiactinospora gelatinilytica]